MPSINGNLCNSQVPRARGDAGDYAAAMPHDFSVAAPLRWLRRQRAPRLIGTIPPSKKWSWHCENVHWDYITILANFKRRIWLIFEEIRVSKHRNHLDPWRNKGFPSYPVGSHATKFNVRHFQRNHNMKLCGNSGEQILLCWRIS